VSEQSTAADTLSVTATIESVVSEQSTAGDTLSAVAAGLFAILDVDGNSVDPTVHDNQEDVKIACLNAGAVQGIVDFGGVEQTNVTWPEIASGESTITVPFIDSGALELGFHELRVLKPI
jgi:hypothetical protein